MDNNEKFYGKMSLAMKHVTVFRNQMNLLWFEDLEATFKQRHHSV